MVRVRYSFGSRHTGKLGNIKKQKKKFPAVVEEVIRNSDIILEVLDARFVKETRNLSLEEFIKKLGKEIIFVLNKADLVDKREVEKKLKTRPSVFVSCKTGLGANILRERIKIKAKKSSLKKIQIGIIGYPNTGKSSLINLLARKGNAKISKQAGFTKGVQRIRLSENILLLDTPGVIPNEEYSDSKNENISKDTMLGARTFANVKNPEDVVSFLMKEKPKLIEKFYNVDAKNDSEILIEEVGRKKGFLKKGNEIDTDRTARKILRDWQEGKIS